MGFEMRQSGMTIERAIQPVWTNDQTETPTKVTGKDGKTYPTKKPRKAKTADRISFG
jgi:hypothetical protein